MCIRDSSTISPVSPSTQDESKINLAHAYILNEDFQKAIDLLDRVEASINISNRKKEEILFIKALAFIGAENRSRATTLLKEIIDKDNRFKPRAQAILEML